MGCGVVGRTGMKRVVGTLFKETIMKQWLIGGGAVAMGLFFLSLSAADDKKAADDKASANLAVIKKLAGDWYEADKDGKATTKLASQIRVTAGGSAVREILFPGTDMEMVSIYTQEGSDLVMTHYCVLGNQPRMKAEAGSTARKIVWKCVGGGNIKLDKDTYMGGGTLTIVDDDHLTFECIKCENGKPCEGQHKMQLVRKK